MITLNNITSYESVRKPLTAESLIESCRAKFGGLNISYKVPFELNFRNEHVTGLCAESSVSLWGSILGPEFEDRYDTIESRLEFWLVFSKVFHVDVSFQGRDEVFVNWSDPRISAVLDALGNQGQYIEDLPVYLIIEMVLVTDMMIGGSFTRGEVNEFIRQVNEVMGRYYATVGYEKGVDDDVVSDHVQYQNCKNLMTHRERAVELIAGQS
jgi:hypothetical protein